MTRWKTGWAHFFNKIKLYQISYSTKDQLIDLKIKSCPVLYKIKCASGPIYGAITQRHSTVLTLIINRRSRPIHLTVYIEPPRVPAAECKALLRRELYPASLLQEQGRRLTLRHSGYYSLFIRGLGLIDLAFILHTARNCIIGNKNWSGLNEVFSIYRAIKMYFEFSRLNIRAILELCCLFRVADLFVQ